MMGSNTRASRKENELKGPRCRFCGRRNTVRRLEGRRYYCDHCQQMFQVE